MHTVDHSNYSNIRSQYNKIKHAILNLTVNTL